MTDPSVLARLQDAFWHRAEELLYHHTNPWELDEALTDWGYAIGPCEAQDLLGLSVVLDRSPERRTPVLRRMVAEGRLGKIGGVGFYRYPGGGGAVIDPLIEDLILEEAWFGKVTRTELSDAELVSRMNAALADVLNRDATKMAEPSRLSALLSEAVGFPETRDPGALLE